jgi:RND family efflux transporter MFP subunit
MNHRVCWLLLASSLLWAGGCKRSSASQGLPPPTGSLAIPDVPAPPPSAGTDGATEVEQWVVSGPSAPVREAKLGPKASGVIAAMSVEEGDKVKRGQVLFRLDASTTAMGIAQAEAALATATVNRDAAESDFKRVQPLLERGSISPSAFDQAKARYDGAAAGVAQAQAAVNMAKKVTGDTVVVSPIDGVVAARKASVGDTVTMMPPTTVLIVQDVSSLEVRTRVPETWLRRLEPGKSIRIRFPYIEAQRVVPITRINPSVDSMTRTVEVVALVPNKDGALTAGMLVEVDFGSSVAGAAPSAGAGKP